MIELTPKTNSELQMRRAAWSQRDVLYLQPTDACACTCSHRGSSTPLLAWRMERSVHSEATIKEKYSGNSEQKKFSNRSSHTRAMGEDLLNVSNHIADRTSIGENLLMSAATPGSLKARAKCQMPSIYLLQPMGTFRSSMGSRSLNERPVDDSSVPQNQ